MPRASGHASASRYLTQGRGEGGFTLLELLVSLVLIGIILTFATLSIGDGGRGDQIAQEARRLAALLELVGDEAILDGRQYGLQLNETGYRFLVRSRGSWGLAEDDLLRPRELPADLALALAIEGRHVDLPTKYPRKEIKPQLLLLSSGERTAFELRVGQAQGGTALWRVWGGPVGRLELAPQEGRL